MRPPTAWEGPSVVMFGMRPVMSPMEACTNVSPKAGLSLAEGSSAAAAEEEDRGQSKERDPGTAGREETPATHVTSSPAQAEREQRELRRGAPARPATKPRGRWPA